MIKRAYYYLFYKLYKSMKASAYTWLSDLRAGIVIVILETQLLFIIGNYYSALAKKIIKITIYDPIVYLPILAIFTINYVMFIHTDRWKKYVVEFDKLPKRTNRIGSWIVFGLIAFVELNLFFSLYLISQVDWSLYR